MGLGVGRPPAGVLQSLADVGALEPVGLLAVEAQGAVVDLRQHDPVLGQAQQQVLRHGRDAGGHAQVAHEIVDRGDEVGDPPLVLDGEDVEGDLGGDVGVPVPVAADPRAEAEGPGPHAQVDTQAGQLPGEVLQDVGHDRPAQLLEVVLDGAGLLRRLGLALAQLVGLPHEVDHLGEAALDPVPLRGRGILAGPEQLGHLAHLGEHRPAGGLGGVRREHGAQLEPADDVVDEGRGHPVGLDPVDGLGQETALARGALEVAGLVDLLDDVGQVEPGREGPHQQDLGGQVDAGQHRCQPGVGLGLVVVGVVAVGVVVVGVGVVGIAGALRPVAPGGPLHLLDEGRQGGTLLAVEGLPEHAPDPLQVGPDRGSVGVGLGDGVEDGRRPAGGHLGSGVMPRRPRPSSAPAGGRRRWSPWPRRSRRGPGR